MQEKLKFRFASVINLFRPYTGKEVSKKNLSFYNARLYSIFGYDLKRISVVAAAVVVAA